MAASHVPEGRTAWEGDWLLSVIAKVVGQLRIMYAFNEGSWIGGAEGPGLWKLMIGRAKQRIDRSSSVGKSLTFSQYEYV